MKLRCPKCGEITPVADGASPVALCRCGARLRVPGRRTRDPAGDPPSRPRTDRVPTPAMLGDALQATFDEFRSANLDLSRRLIATPSLPRSWTRQGISETLTIGIDATPGALGPQAAVDAVRSWTTGEDEVLACGVLRGETDWSWSMSGIVVEFDHTHHPGSGFIEPLAVEVPLPKVYVDHFLELVEKTTRLLLTVVSSGPAFRTAVPAVVKDRRERLVVIRDGPVPAGPADGGPTFRDLLNLLLEDDEKSDGP